MNDELASCEKAEETDLDELTFVRMGSVSTLKLYASQSLWEARTTPLKMPGMDGRSFGLMIFEAAANIAKATRAPLTV